MVAFELILIWIAVINDHFLKNFDSILKKKLPKKILLMSEKDCFTVLIRRFEMPASIIFNCAPEQFMNAQLGTYLVAIVTAFERQK